MFKILAVLVAIYVARSIATGSVYARSGLWGTDLPPPGGWLALLECDRCLLGARRHALAVLRSRMHVRDESQTPSVLLPVFVLGAAGFAAGFFGPMVLNPGANQGPMLGIFISGPGGALLGLALGVVSRVLGVPPRIGRVVLTAVAVLLAGATFFYCLPGPETRGLVVAGEITACQPPEVLTDAAVDEWQKTIARTPWGKPRAGWQRDLPRMLRESPGVVITLQVRRTNRVLEHRKPWNAGELSTAGWQAVDETSRYFADYAGADCAAYRDETPLLYVRHGQGSTVWPPDDLSNFLGLARIESAPESEGLLTEQP